MRRMDQVPMQSFVSPSTNRLMTLLNNAENNLLVLVKQALNDAKLRSELVSAEYEFFWQDHYFKLSNKAKTVPLLTKNSTPLFINFAVWLLNENGCGQEVMSYLEIAALQPYYCLQALTTLANQAIQFLPQSPEPFAVINRACQYAQLAAQRYHTPGYLLAGDVHFSIGQFLQDTDDVAATASYQLAYQNLLVAKTLEQYCEKKIFVAYGEHGIAASNRWRLDSIPKIIDQLLKFLHDNRFDINKMIAEKAARAESQAIIENYCLDQDSTDDMFSSSEFSASSF
ncbi:MAG: DUF5630 domain-containing protein [Pseudomonadota bacterium]|nr:DUF5630 domain-containing protein [Pseudomonadota bacterium]